MAKSLKVLMVSSEAIPFAKAGGLADVVPALSKSLAHEGHDVKILLPRYYSIDRKELDPISIPLDVNLGTRVFKTRIFTTILPASTVRVYFLDFEELFGREGIYGTSQGDHADNLLRFSLLSRASFALCNHLGWVPDILHAHDWPTAPALGYLKTRESHGKFAKTAGVYSIHNIGYQGIFDPADFEIMDLPWSEYRLGHFEFWGKINFMQGALRHADMITTVSEGYAKEIIGHQFGYGMEGILAERIERLKGILNGMEYDLWNPSIDIYIPQVYDFATIESKAANKTALQKKLGLKQNPKVPIFGIISRMVGQKGFVELAAPGFGCLQNLLKDFDIQVVVLGTGEKWCEDELVRLSKLHPNLSVQLAYNESLSHLIQAGSDFFVMPSLYEPCGLTQMYALRYGTIPLVTPTGGLADTVKDIRISPKTGTGIYIETPIQPSTIVHAVKTAIDYYTKKPDLIREMQERGMSQVFDWKKASKEYEKVYKKALEFLK